MDEIHLCELRDSLRQQFDGSKGLLIECPEEAHHTEVVLDWCLRIAWEGPLSFPDLLLQQPKDYSSLHAHQVHGLLSSV